VDLSKESRAADDSDEINSSNVNRMGKRAMAKMGVSNDGETGK
jgi:hypothetical protein